jgi:histone deacetylase 1/2
LLGANVSRWKNALSEELKSLKKNHTWNLTTLPPNWNVINCKWIFKVKFNLDGTIAKYKARLVAKGYTQQEGIDYQKTFSPVLKLTSIRMLLALMIHHKLDIQQMDVKTLFFNDQLDEKIYMEIPKGLLQEQRNSKLVHKLEKALYGLKQSPHQ